MSAFDLAVAPLFKVEVSSFNKRDTSEIERVVAAFAQSPNGGPIMTAGGPALLNRDLIITLAARTAHVRFWPFASVAAARYFVRYWTTADIGRNWR
jgi:hypothetical protein